jgi:hypothetical protein
VNGVRFTLDASVVERHREWTECAAFRFVDEGETVRLQFVPDLELITRPEGANSDAS